MCSDGYGNELGGQRSVAIFTWQRSVELPIYKKLFLVYSRLCIEIRPSVGCPPETADRGSCDTENSRQEASYGCDKGSTEELQLNMCK